MFYKTDQGALLDDHGLYSTENRSRSTPDYKQVLELILDSIKKLEDQKDLPDFDSNCHYICRTLQYSANDLFSGIAASSAVEDIENLCKGPIQLGVLKLIEGILSGNITDITKKVIGGPILDYLISAFDSEEKEMLSTVFLSLGYITRDCYFLKSPIPFSISVDRYKQIVEGLISDDLDLLNIVHGAISLQLYFFPELPGSLELAAYEIHVLDRVRINHGTLMPCSHLFEGSKKVFIRDSVSDEDTKVLEDIIELLCHLISMSDYNYVGNASADQYEMYGTQLIEHILLEFNNNSKALSSKLHVENLIPIASAPFSPGCASAMNVLLICLENHPWMNSYLQRADFFNVLTDFISVETVHLQVVSLKMLLVLLHNGQDQSYVEEYCTLSLITSLTGLLFCDSHSTIELVVKILKELEKYIERASPTVDMEQMLDKIRDSLQEGLSLM